MYIIVQAILFVLQIAFYVIIAQAILSWLVAFNVLDVRRPPFGQIWMALHQLTEPIYRPIRKVVPSLGGLDFTPMVVLFGIYILQMVIIRAYNGVLLA